MNKVACALWSVALLLLVAPWFVATILVWIYTEVFEEAPEVLSQPKLGWISAILQTVSLVAYLCYIPSMVLFIGFAGRRSLFSFCCLVVGVPVFAVAPMVAGGSLLYSALDASDKGVKEVGIAAAVCCLFSTVTCCFLLWWAIACGGKGRGKNHRYPTPLAYFPYIKDFKEVRTEKEVDDSDRYTADFPPPLYTFADRKPLSPSAVAHSEERRMSHSSSMCTSERRASMSSTRTSERRTSLSSSTYTPDRRTSISSTRTAERRTSTSSAEQAPLSPSTRRTGRRMSASAIPEHTPLPPSTRRTGRRMSASSMPERTPLPPSTRRTGRRMSTSNFTPIAEHSSTRRAERQGSV